MEISPRCLNDCGLETDAVPIYDNYKFKDIENVAGSSGNSDVAQKNNKNVGVNVKCNKKLSEDHPTDFCNKSSSTVNNNRINFDPITQEMQRSSESLTPQMLSTIAIHIGFGWKDLMKELNHSDGELFNAITDNHFMGNKEIRCHLLLNWQKWDRSPTIGRVVTILLKSGRQEVIDALKNDYKLMKNQNRQWNYC